MFYLQRQKNIVVIEFRRILSHDFLRTIFLSRIFDHLMFSQFKTLQIFLFLQQQILLLSHLEPTKRSGYVLKFQFLNIIKCFYVSGYINRNSIDRSSIIQLTFIALYTSREIDVFISILSPALFHNKFLWVIIILIQNDLLI